MNNSVLDTNGKDDSYTMYTIPPKKVLIINILDILKKYSDQEHRLSQKDIETILERDYSMKADRKSIKRNLIEPDGVEP